MLQLFFVLPIKLPEVAVGRDAPSFDGGNTPLGVFPPSNYSPLAVISKYRGGVFPQEPVAATEKLFMLLTLKALEMHKHYPNDMPKPLALLQIWWPRHQAQTASFSTS